MSPIARFRRAAVVAVLGAASLFAVLAATSTAPAAAVTLPADNVLSNPSFEGGVIAPWTTVGVTTTNTLSGSLTPPEGSYVAKLVPYVRSGGGLAMSIDNWPGETTSSTPGVTYSGSVYVAAANAATAGKTATLTVREHDAAGNTVAQWDSAGTALSATAFKHITVSGTVHAAGDFIDIYVSLGSPASGSAMYVDAFSLTSRYPMPITNQVTNPSFEGTTSGNWTAGAGTTFTHPVNVNAPDRDHVAQLSFTGTAGADSSIHQVLSLSTTANQAYLTSVLVRAGNAAATSHHVLLRVYERNSGGTIVRTTDSPTPLLTTTFAPLTIAAVAMNDGDSLDVNIIEQSANPGDVVQADAASVAQIVSGLGELAINYDQQGNLGATAKYEYVVLQSNHHDDPNLISNIHAAARSAFTTTRVFGYFNAALTRQDVSDPAQCAANAPEFTSGSGFGLNYCWVSNNHGGTNGHDDWFLHSGTPHTPANRMTFGTYGTPLALMNISLPAYQNEWAANVLPYLNASGFDGLYLDDVNTRPGHGFDGLIDGMTDAQYGANTVAFMQNVGSQAHTAGLLTLGNVQIDLDPSYPWELPDAQLIASALDGVNKEFISHEGSNDYDNHYADCNEGSYSPPASDARFDTLLSYAATIQAQTVNGHNTNYTGIDYDLPSDQAFMAYGRATFYLFWRGASGSGAYFNRTCSAGDPADPTWTLQLGLPTDPPNPALTGGLYVRHYTDGIVVLNPSSTTDGTIKLDGTFTDQLGVNRTGTLTVPHQTAFLLRRVSYN